MGDEGFMVERLKEGRAARLGAGMRRVVSSINDAKTRERVGWYFVASQVD